MLLLSDRPRWINVHDCAVSGHFDVEFVSRRPHRHCDLQIYPRSLRHDTPPLGHFTSLTRGVSLAAMICGAMTIVLSKAPARNAAAMDVSK